MLTLDWMRMTDSIRNDVVQGIRRIDAVPELGSFGTIASCILRMLCRGLWIRLDRTS